MTLCYINLWLTLTLSTGICSCSPVRKRTVELRWGRYLRCCSFSSCRRMTLGHLTAGHVPPSTLFYHSVHRLPVQTLLFPRWRSSQPTGRHNLSRVLTQLRRFPFLWWFRHRNSCNNNNNNKLILLINNNTDIHICILIPNWWPISMERELLKISINSEIWTTVYINSM